MPAPEGLLSLEFPVESFPEGQIAPPMEPDHPTWALMPPWTDPLADRGAYRTPSSKERVETPHGPAIRFTDRGPKPHALVTGEPWWRNARLKCRVLPTARGVERCNDGWFLADAHAGLVFRIETSRRYYFFGVEARDRLVLYRRNDDDWHVLDWRRVELPDGPLTLHAELQDDLITVSCPECEVELYAREETFPSGRMGFRSLGESELLDLSVELDAEERARNAERRAALRERTERLGREVPDAVPAGEFDLSGALSLKVCRDFAAEGRNDLLFNGPDGLLARTWEGEELWRHPEPALLCEPGPARPEGGRRLYLLVGCRHSRDALSVAGHAKKNTVADEVVVLDGTDGRELVRTKLPEDPVRTGELRKYDLSSEVGCGKRPGELDFTVRQWRQELGGAGVHLWAYDMEGDELWQRQVETPYGHHGAVHCADINRDGELEVLAGGTCFSARGELMWTHDMADEMRRIHGADHYDSVLVQPPELWPHADPLVVLAGGSAGVYVVDALTGRTCALYRVGHAQWTAWGRLRDDIPGPQFMVGTRWGNYGILCLFSPAGDRLWAAQPDYVLQGSKPVKWRTEGPEFMWINTSESGMGLYDGHCRLVKPLEPLRRAFRGKTRMQVSARALRRRPGGRHRLALTIGERMLLFRPES